MTAVMICRSVGYIKFDAREPRPDRVLTFGGPFPAAAGAEAAAGPIIGEYFRALADAASWADVDTLVLGNSMHQWLPSVILRSLLRAAEAVAGRPLAAARAAPAPSPQAGRIEQALASWLGTTVARLGADDELLTFREVEYFVVSGGYRGGALIMALDALAPGRPLRRVTDVGTGVGIIPLVLAAQPPQIERSVCLVEPMPQYVERGKQLWACAAGPGLSFEFHQCRAEEAPPAAERDLIFFGQCFFRIEPERRRDVLAQISRTLADGGHLIVNEAVRADPAAPEPEWDKRYPECLTAGELIGILSALGPVSLLRRTSDWRQPEDPRTLKAAEIGTDSFFVIARR